MEYCEASFDVNDCAESQSTAMTYFILEAISNFDNFLTQLANSVDQTHGYVDGKAAEIVETFSSAPDDLVRFLLLT
jgi:hypothetical protein